TPSEFFDITPLIDTTQFEIIPLESHSEAIIGDISDVYIRDNKIIVVDKRRGQSFSFSREGKFLNQLGKTGEGPEEYIPSNINSILVEKDKIGYYDFCRRSITYYSFDNQYLHTHNNFLISSFNIYPIDDELVCMTEFRKNETGLNHIQILQKNNQIKSFLPFDNSHLVRGWGVERNDFRVGNDLYFHVTTKDTLFRYSKETGVTPLYAIDIQGNKIPEEKKYGPGIDAVLYSIANEAVLGMNSIAVLKDILFLKFDNAQVIYNMKTNERLAVSKICHIKNWGAHALIHINTKSCSIRDGYIIQSVNAEVWDMIRQYPPKTNDGQNSRFNKELWKRTNSVTAEANPFLILFKIKEGDSPFSS
ncbi:MAG: 6-bladed beta-propeller, partial [Bacteroidales bacterium]